MQLEDLKPCPFCGSAPIESEVSGDYANDKWLEIRCSNCGAKIEEYPDERSVNLIDGSFNMSVEQESCHWENSRKLLREKWNTRV